MTTQPNVDYLIPPVVINIGNPIVNMPGCVKMHKDDKRHKIIFQLIKIWLRMILKVQ